MASTSMMYTMGMALDRAAENGVGVSILVEGSWVDGLVGAVDGMGVVLESSDGDHTVIRVDRIAAVKVHSESPLRPSLARCPSPAEADPGPMSASMPSSMPGPRSA